MSDRITMARAARQKLAQALATLQHPGIPADLFFVAEPVAEAMMLLHELEAAGADAPRTLASDALMAVRRALSGLQAQAARHPAIALCVEGVAGALNLAHVLTTLPPPRPEPRPSEPPPSVAPRFPDYRPPTDLDPGPAPPPATAERASHSRPSLQTAALDPLLARDAQRAEPPIPRPAGPGLPGSRGGAPAPEPVPQRGPASARRRVGLAATEDASASDARVYRPPGASVPPDGDALRRIEVELDAHGPSNFYKGLAGTNPIDTGGVFVATYALPRVGEHVRLSFRLPAGYTFEAKGVVTFLRDESRAGDVPPGFGARFTELPLEGVTLVTRYVRNREPLLFDEP